MPRLSVLDLRGDRRDPRDRLPRPREAVAANVPRVAEILRDVRERGDAAVRELTQQFDDVEVDDLEVPAVVRRAALDGLPAPMRAALERAVSQVRWFHERARPPDWEDERDGAVMGVWHRPVQRVGVYVPGGKGAFPSTVVMAVVPAQVAGVDEIVLSSPPTGGDGWPDRTVLAAAELLGVDTVLRIGGAQAIAALAYGTVSVPSVDMVVGPGTVWTALAKVQVQAEGVCGIDSMAGPTEIAIIADATADPRVLAADLVAQAEHDELAGVLLVTTFPGIVPEVEAALEREIATTRHRERVETALAGQGTVALVEDVDQAVQVAEAYAAEHLEVHTEAPRSVAERVRYAGTTFVGPDTPVSLGDYAAGPNHTLPVLGTARFAGGLTTSSFLVPVNFVQYDHAALVELADTVRAFAAVEDLPAHARAVEIRLDIAAGGDGTPGGAS